ncbi:DUF6069 family protein [Cryptosporangium minutisporangium]|uniref:Uncharacterized protein n=1 Tax=Cryptosporangium minutisporangium TaxID=113569 RepID=A0ABP6SY36_9ACTN
MTRRYPSEGTAGGPPGLAVDAGRLWAGGFATALVAALIVVTGILIARGVFDIAIMAPKGQGVWGDATTVGYALGAGLLSLAATGLMHVLILSTPRPMRFFSWIVGLATVVGVVAPFAGEAPLSAKFTTAVLNLVLGAAIGALVAGTARSAVRTVPPGGVRDRYR